MEILRRQILNTEPINLAETAERLKDIFPELARAADKPYRRGKRTLLTHTQETLDALLEHPPPSPYGEPSRLQSPWWWPMPAAYAAALFHDLGRLEKGSQPESGEDDHPRTSAEMARQIMLRLGLPFDVREHAVALIRHHISMERYEALDVRDEKVLTLSCILDLPSLYSLRRANYRPLKGRHVQRRLDLLEAFRQRCEQLKVYGQPAPPPLEAAELQQLGAASEREAFYVGNALRYFRIVHEIDESNWFRDRAKRLTEGKPRQFNLLVGVAGCGKSTWARKHLSETVIVSTDEMREELTGDPSEQRMNDVVFNRCMQRITKHLDRGEAVTFDATNYSAESRSLPLKRARWHDARVIAWFFDLPLETALQRNEARERKVPEDVVRRQERRLTVPALHECDELHVVSEDGSTQRYWPLQRFEDG